MSSFDNPPAEFADDVVTLSMCTPRKIQLECDLDDRRFEALRFSQYLTAGLLGGFGLLGLWAAFVAFYHYL